jgi:hypothetical protein
MVMVDAKGTLVAALFAATVSASVAHAECNLRDVFFGQIAIEIVTHDVEGMPGIRYETGIIVDNTGTSKIRGQIGEPERDGSRPILNANGENCGRLESNFRITDGDLPLRLRRVSSNSFVVFNGNTPVGTIEGRLNNDEDKASDPATLARMLKQLATPSVAADACAPVIPADLRDFIRHKFPEFSLPRQSDYRADDIAIELNVEHSNGCLGGNCQRAQRGNGCLGIATGSYYDENVINYAIIITSISKKHTNLIVANRAGATWKLDLVKDWDWGVAGMLYVATVEPGGTYRSFDLTGPVNRPTKCEKSTRNRPSKCESFIGQHQGIELGKIGSASDVYFFDRKAWVYVPTSD